MTEWQEFHGGVNVVRRRGDVIYRPVSAASPAIHRLLRHVRDEGFHGAPEPLGFDGGDLELLTFLDGEVHDTLTPPLRTPELLASAATLLRHFHDATTAFPAHPDDHWLFPARSPIEVVCHGDIAPYNCVVKDGRAVGFIDFDASHPGPRIWDLAYAVYRFAPLHAPDNPESFGTLVEQGQRAASFCHTYGPHVDAEVIDVVPDRLQALIDLMREQAARGNEAFQRHIADGHADLYQADIRYVRTNRDTLRRAFDTLT